MTTLSKVHKVCCLSGVMGHFVWGDGKKYFHSSIQDIKTYHLHAKSIQLCSTPCNPMDSLWSPPGPSVHLQARILQWIAMTSSRGSFPSRDQTHVSCISCIGRLILFHCTILEAAYHLQSQVNSTPFSFPCITQPLSKNLKCLQWFMGKKWNNFKVYKFGEIGILHS